MDMAEIDKHPADIFKNEIRRFIGDIESLYITLPFLYIIIRTLEKGFKEKCHEYVQNNAKHIETKDGITHFNLDIEKNKRWKELSNQHDNFDNACRLLPRQFVISLVAQYDSFLSHVIRFIFNVCPNVLNASDKNISYSDLIKFPDMATAQEYVIEKEVEDVIRASHAEHFNWLEKKLNRPLRKGLDCWPTFIELTERRNLFVHTDGRVSSQYINVCRNNGVSVDIDIRVGDVLKVSEEYFVKAYECIFEIGVKLAHVVWRCLCKDGDQNIECDDSINTIAYEVIDNGQYTLAINLLSFFSDKTMKHPDEVLRLMMLINLAQAHKWNKDETKCKEILDQVDWGPCEDKFKLAVATLRENYEDVYSIMKRLQYDNNFLRSYYCDWPIFKKLRTEEEFQTVFEECYKEPFANMQVSEKEMNDKTEEITSLTSISSLDEESSQSE